MNKQITLKLIRNIFSTIIGVTIFIYFFFILEKNSLNQIFKISYFPVVFAFIATIGITSVISFRWGMLLNYFSGQRVASWTEYYHYFISSRFIGLFLPKDVIDIIVRSIFLKKSHGINWKLSGASVLFDRFFDLIIMVLLSVASIPFWMQWFSEIICLFILFSVMVLGIFVVLAGQKTAYHIYKTIINIINTLLSTFKREHQKKKLIKYENLRIGREVLIKAYIFSIMKYVLTIIRFIFFTKAFNLNIPILVLIFGTPLGQIAYMFSFTPGGIGIFEAGWYGVLKYSGVDSQTGAMFVIGQRFLTIILVGACAFTSNIIQSIRKTKVDNLTNTLGTKE